MCELKVMLDNKEVFENVIFAKTVGNKVVVKDILGQSKEFKNCTISEVNISKEQLILTSQT